MAALRFGTLDDVRYGIAEPLSPLVRRVIAENPSKYTYRGTGTYIVGHGQVAVVDPGPRLDSHRDALAAALEGEEVVAIAVTHCHADHSQLSAWLHDETGAPRYAFGPHPPQPPDAVEAVEGDVDTEDAIDTDFAPDVAVADGEIAATGPGWTLRGIHTPGHTSNHLCFALEEERTLFSGDHVMGWSTTVVTPPDGDMRAYLDSLERVLSRGDAVLRPTHGPAIDDPRTYVSALIEHRRHREAAIVGSIRDGLDTIDVIVASLYADVREALHRAAARSVLAHLVKLVDDGIVTTADGAPPAPEARYVVV